MAIWIDGRIIHANGLGKGNADRAVELTAGHRHHIRIEYINPDGRAELKLLWRSRVTDPQEIPAGRLFTE